MSERALTPAPEHPDQGGWLDDYMPANQVAHYEHQPKQIDISTIRGILYRQRWLVAGIVLIAAIAGIVFTLLATPMYSASSSVRLEPYGNFIVEGQDVEQSLPSNQIGDLISTNLSVLISQSLARTVAENLDLASRPGFLGDMDATRPPNISDAEWNEQKLNAAAQRLQRGVSADLPDGNWIIEITYQSEDPVFAAEAANAYALAFASMEMRDSVENNEYAQQYLQEQIGLTRTRLQSAEQAANRYARENGIILQSVPTADGEGSATLNSVNLASINERVAAAQAERIAAEQLWRSTQNLPAVQLAEAQGNALLQGLIAERAQAQSELAALRQRYFDAHPENAAKISQIEALDAQIASTSADIKAAIRNRYIVAQNQEQALRAELAASTSDTLQEQDRRVGYSVLEREAQALRDQLQVLLERFNQVSAANNVQTGRVNLLDRATVPRAPYSPSLVRNLAIALVMGMALAGGLAVLRETLDDRIRSIGDVEERTGLTVFGQTPYLPERTLENETGNRFGTLVEAYASIKSAIDFAIPRDRSILQLTSTQASEGKSTTAVILAELFAASGRRTLLVDADVRRPSIASLLEIERPKVGLTEVVLGHTDLHSAVIKGYHDNLDILPIAQRPSNPGELLASRELKQFLDACRNEYSLVILDSCPVLGLADAPNLSRLVDGTIFVMAANEVGFGQVRNATRRLRASGGKTIGGILTKYRSLEAGEAYSYQYSYYEYGDKPRTT